VHATGGLPSDPGLRVFVEAAISFVVTIGLLAWAALRSGRRVPFVPAWETQQANDAVSLLRRRLEIVVSVAFAALLQAGIVQTVLDPPAALTPIGSALLVAELVVVAAWALALVVQRPRGRKTL
jgi:hypothetical protein